MSKLQLKKRFLEVDCYGEEYKLSFPSLSQAATYKEQCGDGQDEGKILVYLLDLLDDLGLPKKVSKDMEIDHVMQIMEALMPEKKR